MPAHDPAPIPFASKSGHLLRELRLLQSLYFQRDGGQRFYMTLVNSRLGRLGLSLDVPRVGKLILAVYADSGRLRLNVCREPGRELLSIDTAPFEPLSIPGAGGACLRVMVQRAARDELILRFDVPTVGTATIAFHLHRDRVRAAITVDKTIRVLPAGHRRETATTSQYRRRS